MRRPPPAFCGLPTDTLRKNRGHSIVSLLRNSATIASLTQTKDGTLWVGAHLELALWNGKRFQVVRPLRPFRQGPRAIYSFMPTVLVSPLAYTWTLPSAQRKIARRLLPFLFLLYVTAFIDRVNVSFAGLQMTRELNFSNEVFGFGAGIFFFGYCLLEIPGAMLAQAWSARKWIAGIMVSWGILATSRCKIALLGYLQTVTGPAKPKQNNQILFLIVSVS